MTFKIDLHSHSTVSDGLDTPTALVEKMSRAGISVLALTDHDGLDGSTVGGYRKQLRLDHQNSVADHQRDSKRQSRSRRMGRGIL